MMLRRELIKRSLIAATAFVSPTVAAAVEAGVSGHQKRKSASVLSPMQRQMVSVLSELIIPKTDTPGALDAGVPDFIDVIVSEWYRPGERDIFLKGLQSLEDFCRAKGVAFIDADESLQSDALKHSEKESMNYRSPAGAEAAFGKTDEKTPFFKKLKELVVLGYYTSEIGATQELVYNPAPGYFDGDYDFEKVGRQWSS